MNLDGNNAYWWMRQKCSYSKYKYGINELIEKVGCMYGNDFPYYIDDGDDFLAYRNEFGVVPTLTI